MLTAIGGMKANFENFEVPLEREGKQPGDTWSWEAPAGPGSLWKGTAWWVLLAPRAP